MRKLLPVFGKLLLMLASMAFITATFVFMAGAFLTSYPVLGLSPRNRKVVASNDLLRSVVQAYQVFKIDMESETE